MTPLSCACAVVITLESQKCRKGAHHSVEFTFFFINRPFAQLLSGFETGHLAAVGPSPAYDFRIFDEKKAVFLSPFWTVLSVIHRV